MTISWTLKAGEKVYGPYTLERLRALADDGRFGPQSLIAPEGASDWREANLEADFAGWFSAPAPKPNAPDSKTADTRLASAATAATADATTPAPSKSADAREKTQYVIVLDVKSGRHADIDTMIGGLGSAYQLFPMVWILASNQTPAGIRNTLLPHLATRDILFIVDATHGKATWLNFAPEAAAHIRSIWQKAS